VKEEARDQATGRAANSSPFAALAPILRCPYCEGPLVLEERALTCPTGHSFDLAREGYANLSQSRQTGDSTEMLRARRRFLEAGHYQPLSNLINLLVAEHCRDTPSTVLDAGCGEGYYLGRLHQSRPCQVLGLDAAKDAARMAAGRYRAAAFLVADLKERLPLAAGEVHVILNIFAPRHAKEFARILRPDGLLLSVIPEPDHLGELRRLLPLLGIEERKADQVRATLEREFIPSGAKRLSYPLSLTGGALEDLVGMTPSARHLDDTARAALLALGSAPLTVTASFLVLSFRPRYT
jgi:23S rRNA (guanine745-N1)-methyltransferase